MISQIEAMYETIEKHTQSLASKKPMGVKFAMGAVGVNIAAASMSKALKAPRSIAESMHPNMRSNMGSGKYGIGAGGSSDMGTAGLKFTFKKKR